jgi:hypothetical protein
MHHTATKGNIGVAKAIADLMLKGWDVSIPFCATSPFDLVAYRNGKFVRVQVKYRILSKGVIDVRCMRHSNANGKAKQSSNDEADVVCVYDAAGDKCYYVLASMCPIALRLRPTRNGQKKNVWSADAFLDF